MSEKNKSLFWHRAKLLAFIGVFLSPFIGGWMALYVFDVRPTNGNYGTLVEPVKRVSWPVIESTKGDTYENGLGRQWSFIMFSNGLCAELCQSNLYYMRQLRILLGRDTPRISNVFISTQPISEELKTFFVDYPNLIVIDEVDEPALFKQFQIEGEDAVGGSPKLYLVDPDQNYMMYYPAENDHNKILEDIRKLIKLSQIG
ncbi:MAG: cytochrome oxidase Cu insertion factor (SCO1/SenC/PrrC family) [Gammaproteobacteria bacterium]|jgi:cytochrome oxidase Cu insertion factor (SCO1/SenC/PrrC family)